MDKNYKEVFKDLQIRLEEAMKKRAFHQKAYQDASIEVEQISSIVINLEGLLKSGAFGISVENNNILTTSFITLSFDDKVKSYFKDHPDATAPEVQKYLLSKGVEVAIKRIADSFWRLGKSGDVEALDEKRDGYKIYKYNKPQSKEGGLFKNN